MFIVDEISQKRRQSVVIANRISSTKELHYGVPQGSVVGPILFALYIQPLSNLIKRHSCVHLFADDIQIKTSILPQHVLALFLLRKYAFLMSNNGLQLVTVE